MLMLDDQRALLQVSSNNLMQSTCYLDVGLCTCQPLQRGGRRRDKKGTSKQNRRSLSALEPLPVTADPELFYCGPIDADWRCNNCILMYLYFLVRGEPQLAVFDYINSYSATSVAT